MGLLLREKLFVSVNLLDLSILRLAILRLGMLRLSGGKELLDVPLDHPLHPSSSRPQLSQRVVSVTGKVLFMEPLYPSMLKRVDCCAADNGHDIYFLVQLLGRLPLVHHSRQVLHQDAAPGYLVI